MHRCRLACVAFALLLSSCAERHDPVLPDPAPDCAATQQEDEKDGGIGGTGRAPGQCGEKVPAD